jgi:hypothetical protein
MTDREALIERAARAIHSCDGTSVLSWDQEEDSDRQIYREDAITVLNAACPGLLNGTAWLAPWEMPDEMWTIIRRHGRHEEGGMQEFTEFYGDFGNWAALWSETRDAHLAKAAIEPKDTPHD